MTENKYIEINTDFDMIVERKNTSSIKYDFAKRRGMPEDVLPLWVADMDFKTSSIVLDRLKERVDHGVFGYTETQQEYFDTVANWMREHHNYNPDIRWMVKTPGVVVALAMAVKAYTDEGDAVLIQQPVYYPFSESILKNQRRAISSDLVLENGRYRMDFEDFEAKIIAEKIKLFILCNPHNPVGRVWTKDELQKIGDICLKHNVIVVSDEIHQDFVYDNHKHTVFATIRPEYEDISITCTSPAKTFNLAGLQLSNIFIPNRELKHKFRKQLDAMGYGLLNAMGIAACEAAYSHGQIWYEKMLQYVKGNIDYVKAYISENIPQIEMIETQGTYLVWLDLRGLHLSQEEQQDLIVNKAKLWLDSGDMFGAPGIGFERINVACPRKILKQAMSQLQAAVEDHINNQKY